MAVPTVGTFTRDWYDELEPLAFDDQRYDYALLKLLESIGMNFQEIEDYARDTDEFPGWSVLLDVDRCPEKALPWLAQFVGATFPTGLTSDQQRDWIRDVPGWRRGTPDSLVAMVKNFLTGGKTVNLRERDAAAAPNDPAYGLTVITYESDTPQGDWGSTNLIPNGGFETDVSGGWTSTQATLARDTSTSKFGAASMKITASAPATGAINVTIDVPISGNTYRRVYTGSIYVRPDPSIASIGGTNAMILRMDAMGGTQPTETGVSTSLNLATNLGWTRVVAKTNVIAQKDRNVIRMTIKVSPNVQIGDILWVDGAQIEFRSDATPYIETNGAIASGNSGLGVVGDALRRAKPAGIKLNYLVSQGQDYQELFTAYADYQRVFTDFPDYQSIVTRQPV